MARFSVAPTHSQRRLTSLNISLKFDTDLSREFGLSVSVGRYLGPSLGYNWLLSDFFKCAALTLISSQLYTIFCI